MMPLCSPLTLIIVLLGFVLSTLCACSKSTEFAGQDRPAGQLVPDPQAPQQVIVPCAEQDVTFSGYVDRRQPKAILIPKICEIKKSVPINQSKNLDLVFVLDVTGSMATSLSNIQKGMEDFVAKLRQAPANWHVRVGAVPFTDKIEKSAESTLVDNVQNVIARMDAERLWNPAMGTGGSNNEIGLAALLEAFNLYDDLDRNLSNSAMQNHKVIVYVSDAPAGLSKTAQFDKDTAYAATEIKKFATKIKKGGAVFSLFFSTSFERDSLEADMPTPSNQFKSLAKQAGVDAVLTKIPFSSGSFDAAYNMINSFPKSLDITEECKLTGVHISKDKSQKPWFLFENIAENGSTEGNWIKNFTQAFESGKQRVTVVRQCQEESETFAYNAYF